MRFRDYEAVEAPEPILAFRRRWGSQTILIALNLGRDPGPPIATLSGGNQQKVVVARWMESEVELLILEEPTIGVDVGSKAEIYRDLDLAHERGRAVLLVSSDFEEVERICHRALVFDRGKIVAEIHRPEITVASLTALSTGSRAAEAAA